MSIWKWLADRVAHDFGTAWDKEAHIDEVLSSDMKRSITKADSLLSLFTLTNGSSAVASLGFIGAILAHDHEPIEVISSAYWIFASFAAGSLVAWVGRVLSHQLEETVYRLRSNNESHPLRDKLMVLIMCIPWFAYVSGALSSLGLVSGLIALYHFTH